MVYVLGEGGTGGEGYVVAVGLLVVAVAKLVDVLEYGGEGVGGGEAGAVCDLSRGARVADGGGQGAHALLVADDVVDDAADVSVEFGGDRVVEGGGHGD